MNGMTRERERKGFERKSKAEKGRIVDKVEMKGRDKMGVGNGEEVERKGRKK